MKKALIVLAVLVLSMSLVAQQRTGNIYGKIVDAERNPLPGVTVTLTGPAMAPLTTVTSEVGMYRFPSIPPGSEYMLKAELQGFKTQSQGNVIVTIGGNAEINMVMEVGKLEEQVTVTASTPTIDTKKTTTVMNVGKEEMQSLPTARDPWVVMQLAPAIMLDRENVGGNESGQQASFLAKGDMSNGGYVGSDNLWAVDGIDITDPAALGGSALYYDFDMFEELNITTGGAADVTVQTGGIALNMVTRRGGNKMSLAGRFYLTDNFFQSENLTPALRTQGILNTNKIQQIKDYGFNAGGPIIKDKLWWWGGYGVQDIFVFTVYNTQDKTLLNNYNFKLNAQLLANNRFEAMVTSGAKEKFGRNAAVAKPEGDHQTGKYHWGSPIIKLQDEHVFGNNIYLSLKYSFNDAGFGWVPMTDSARIWPSTYDNTSAKYVAYQSGALTDWSYYSSSRPRNNYQLNASYFNDTFLGMSHEIKVGAEYSHKIGETQSGEPGSFNVNRNYNTLVLDANGNGARTVAEMAGWQRLYWHRDYKGNSIADQYAGYIQDTITKGNFTVTLGLRYDKQVPGQGAVSFNANYKGTPAWDTVFAAATSDAMLAILPGVSVHSVKGVPNILSGGNRAYQWNTWSPRIGLTWDITGDGKTVAKLALSQYGDVMGVGAYSASPIGTGGNARFWWFDGGWDGAARIGPADGKATLDELFWYNRSSSVNPFIPYRVFDGSGNINAAVLADLVANGYNSQPYLAGMVGGYDWNNKTAVDYVGGLTWWADKKSTQSSTRTREILATLEREIFPDFAAAVTGTYRRYDNNDYWMTYYPTTDAAGNDTGYSGMVDPNGLTLTNLIIDPQHPPTNGPWYVQAGTIPSSVVITYPADGSIPWGGTGDVNYPLGGAAGRPFYLPASYYPITGTPYSVVKKGTGYNTYMGLDFVLTKRLSNKWFANASVTLQNQKAWWGSDYFDATNKWVWDGQPYSQGGGGASGKVSVAMYTRWMAKLSGLYQLPYGFDISGTINAREGWKIPHYVYMALAPADAPNPTYYDNYVYTQNIAKDSLPTFINVTLRLEKKITIGAGRMYLMADVFNLFNAATINRAYDAYIGATYWNSEDTGNVFDTQVSNGYNSTYRRLNEILNPRIWRFGVRFEF